MSEDNGNGNGEGSQFWGEFFKGLITGPVGQIVEDLIPLIKGAGGLDKLFNTSPLKSFLLEQMDRLTRFGVAKDDIERLKSGLLTSKTNNWFADGIIDLTYFLTIIKNVLEGFTGPFEKIITRGFERTLKPNIGSLDDILLHYWRGGKEAQFNDLFKDLGLGDDWKDSMIGSRQSWFDVDSSLKQLFRQTINKEKAYKRFKENGWLNVADYDKIISVNRPLLAGNELLEAYRRKQLVPQTPVFYQTDSAQQFTKGMEDNEQILLAYLRGLGYSEYEIEQVQKLSQPLLDIKTLLEGHFRKSPNVTDIYKQIGQHGFDKPQVDGMIDASKTLLREFDIVQLLWRKQITEDQAKERLGFLGYTVEDQQLFLDSRKLLLTPSDLIRAAVKESFNPEIIKEFGLDLERPASAIEYAKSIGYEEREFMHLWKSHWDLPAPGQGYSLFHRGEITEKQLKLLLKALDITPFWRDKMFKLSYNLIPRRVLSTIVRRGLLDETETVSRFRKLGYNLPDSIIMSRNLIMARDYSQVLLTTSEVSNALRRGFININEATGYFNRLNIKQPKLGYLIAEAERKKFSDAQTETSLTDQEVAEQAKQLTKGELLNNYRKGVFTTEETSNFLLDLGYSITAISWLLNYEDLQKIIEHRNHQADQYEKLYRSGLLSYNNATEQLINVGFAPSETKIIINGWLLEETTKQALDNIRDKKPTVAQLKKWYKAGIMTGDRWVYYMEQLGYGDELLLYHFLEIEDKLED